MSLFLFRSSPQPDILPLSLSLSLSCLYFHLILVLSTHLANLESFPSHRDRELFARFCAASVLYCTVAVETDLAILVSYAAGLDSQALTKLSQRDRMLGLHTRRIVIARLFFFAASVGSPALRLLACTTNATSGSLGLDTIHSKALRSLAPRRSLSSCPAVRSVTLVDDTRPIRLAL